MHLSWSRSRPVAVWEYCPVAPGRTAASPASWFWGRWQGCPIAEGWYERGRRGGHRQRLAVRLFIVVRPDRGMHPGKDRPADGPRPRQPRSALRTDLDLGLTPTQYTARSLTHRAAQHGAVWRTLVMRGSGRARRVPDGAANHRQPRSLAGKSLRRAPRPMQAMACAVSAFQAGHEGSIPFARSNQKPRSSDMSASQLVAIKAVYPFIRARRVPLSCRSGQRTVCRQTRRASHAIGFADR